MTCVRPIKAYRKPGGGIAFDSRAGYSDRKLEVSCGQCIQCRLKRSREWALRCMHEASLHARNSFVTLTYCPQKLPEDGSLHVEHWQKFAKRLRKKVGKFRYFHCGEYGEDNGRPHYHAIIFGVDFDFDRVAYRCVKSHRLYTSATLDEAWGKGFCTIGAVSFESAAYVARYAMKKITGNKASEHYGNRRPEYCTMSRRPGIGAGWFDKFRDDVFPADEVVHDGRRFRVPRFYDERISEAELSVYKKRRAGKAGKFAADRTPERLRDREICSEARLGRFARVV